LWLAENGGADLSICAGDFDCKAQSMSNRNGAVGRLTLLMAAPMIVVVLGASLVVAYSLAQLSMALGRQKAVHNLVQTGELAVQIDREYAASLLYILAPTREHTLALNRERKVTDATIPDLRPLMGMKFYKGLHVNGDISQLRHHLNTVRVQVNARPKQLHSIDYTYINSNYLLGMNIDRILAMNNYYDVSIDHEVYTYENYWQAMLISGQDRAEGIKIAFEPVVTPEHLAKFGELWGQESGLFTNPLTMATDPEQLLLSKDEFFVERRPLEAMRKSVVRSVRAPPPFSADDYNRVSTALTERRHQTMKVLGRNAEAAAEAVVNRAIVWAVLSSAILTTAAIGMAVSVSWIAQRIRRPLTNLLRELKSLSALPLQTTGTDMFDRIQAQDRDALGAASHMVSVARQAVVARNQAVEQSQADLQDEIRRKNMLLTRLDHSIAETLQKLSAQGSGEMALDIRVDFAASDLDRLRAAIHAEI
jgi:hypothetical protein